MQLKMDLYLEAFDKGIIKAWTSENKSVSSTAGMISTLTGLFENLLSKRVLSKRLSKSAPLLPYLAFIIDDTSGKYATSTGAHFMLLFDGIINIIIDGGSGIISKYATPAGGTLASLLFNEFLDRLDTRYKAEFIAFNWYYLHYLWDRVFHN